MTETKTEEQDATPLSKEVEPELIKMDIPTLKAPTIVGKIDLDAINARIRPVRKTRAERKKDAQARYIIEAKKSKEINETFKEKRIKKRQETEKKSKGKQELFENSNRYINNIKKKIIHIARKIYRLLHNVHKWIDDKIRKTAN